MEKEKEKVKVKEESKWIEKEWLVVSDQVIIIFQVHYACRAYCLVHI